MEKEKKVLTAEELGKIRHDAAVKAWVTRRKKMQIDQVQAAVEPKPAEKKK